VIFIGKGWSDMHHTKYKIVSINTFLWPRKWF